jgi:hypothetical protein
MRQRVRDFSPRVWVPQVTAYAFLSGTVTGAHVVSAN